MAAGGDRGRSRGDAGAGAVCVGQVRRRAEGRVGGRGGGPAVELEVSLPGQGRQARHGRARATSATQNPFGVSTRRSRWARRYRSSTIRNCICRSASPSRSCCARTTSCTTSRSRRSASRWTSCPGSSRISGSRRRARETSTCCVRNCAASGTSRCAARSSSRTMPPSSQWLAQQPTFAQTMARPRRRCRGRPGARTRSARACHGAQGEGNEALHAPKLSGSDGWYLKRQLATSSTDCAARARRMQRARRWRRWPRRCPTTRRSTMSSPISGPCRTSRLLSR